jgi:hypothetical protein
MPNFPHKAAMAVAIVVVMLPGFAISQTSTNVQIPGAYSFYSGELGDELGVPNTKDAKVSIMVSGPLAVRMYQHMGNGARSNSCLDDEETRVRDNLICSRKKASGQATCHFGFDLHSGKSIGGTVC